MPKTVIAGVDASGNSLIAADHAAAEARMRGWDVRLVHAMDPAARPAFGLSAGLGLLEEVADRIRRREPGVQVSTVVGLGPPAQVLIDQARGSGLIVVGNGGLGELAGLRRSVSLQLASRSPVPVLVVRVPGLPTGPHWPRRPVLVGVDDSPAGRLAVRLAAGEARLRGVPLFAVHAAPELPIYLEGSTADVLRAGPLADPEVLAGLTVRRLRVDVDPRAALIGLSARACMVVVGSRGRGGLHGYLLGSVSHTLIQLAHCPVLVAHGSTEPAVTVKERRP